LPLKAIPPGIRRSRIEMFPMFLVALWGLGPDATLKEDIAAYARSRLGQKVVNGECTALAVEALRHCATAPLRRAAALHCPGDLG
jgi:hypothetical protein